MRYHCFLSSLLLACAGMIAACSGGTRRTADVRVTSLSPAPRSFSVSRRVEVRTVFDADVDPASISPATCRIERKDGGGPEATTTAYDASTRRLTITPVRALAPLTAYDVVLTRELRAAGGAPFATQIEWAFTTNGDPVWERAAVLAPGRLLACTVSRRGGVLALWAAPDESLQWSRGDGTGWAPPAPVGIDDVFSADVADDGTGRVVVAASTRDGTLRVAAANPGQVFAESESIGNRLLGYVDVDASDSGQIAVAAFDGVASTALRLYVPGVGWAPTYLAGGMIAHVQLRPAGDGIAAAAWKPALFPPVPPGGSARPVLFTVDPLGNWSTSDPLPLPMSWFELPSASKATFRDDRVLLAPTLGGPATVTPLFERTNGTAGPWQTLAPLLGSDPRACDIAQGPLGMAAAALIEAGARPVLRRRIELGFTLEFVGTDEQPAPANPTVGVAITDDFRTHLLWTAAVDNTPAAAVQLLATWLGVDSGLPESLVVDGPFAPEQVPIQNLRVVSFGAAGAAALWTRQGEVRYSAVR